jgi:hypothetical protein
MTGTEQAGSEPLPEWIQDLDPEIDPTSQAIDEDTRPTPGLEHEEIERKTPEEGALLRDMDLSDRAKHDFEEDQLIEGDTQPVHITLSGPERTSDTIEEGDTEWIHEEGLESMSEPTEGVPDDDDQKNRWMNRISQRVQQRRKKRGK